MTNQKPKLVTDVSYCLQCAEKMGNVNAYNDDFCSVGCYGKAVDALRLRNDEIHIIGFGRLPVKYVKKEIYERLRELAADADENYFERLHTNINGGLLFEFVNALKRNGLTGGDQ